MIRILVFLFAFNAWGYVGNPKTGGFTITYTDVVVTGEGEDLIWRRIYNSKALAHGKSLHGNGWSTPFETSLRKTSDGTIIVQENGNGMTTEFFPKNGQTSTTETIAAILDAAKKKGVTGKALTTLQEKLPKDSDLRKREAAKYGLTQVKLKDSTFVSKAGGNLQTVVQEKDGRFSREFDFQKQYFNKDGKLVSTRYNNGYFIDITYNKNGTIASVKDKYAKQLFFSWTSDGKVECAWNKPDAKSCYKYTSGNLVESTDSNGFKYVYAYDSAYNLTKIAYTDGTTREMKYEPRTYHLSQIKDPNGEITTYKYGYDKKNPDLHYWTDVTKVYPAVGDAKSYTVGPNRYEYEYVRSERGDLVTKRISTKVYGIVKVTTYNEACKLPSSIKVGAEETTFKYNAQCLLTEKISSDKRNYTKIEYNKANKISKVVNSDGEHNYRYDNKGNLLQVTFKGAIDAEDGATLASTSINIAYDHLGQIIKITENKSYAGGDRKPSSVTNLTFAYSGGRPVEINSEGVGKLAIQYNTAGEITNINSGAASNVSVSVARTLQLLTRLVKPSGVDFNL